jgi:4-hydroxy-3-methylbut-2-enyl diphosphate reductase
MGVRKAMERTLAERRSAVGTLYTLGPLIHNPQVMELLKRNGVVSVGTEEVQCGSTVIIRAHGVAPEVLGALKEKGAVVINGTCPKVGRIQGMAKKASGEGKAVVIVGDRDHAEVQGILGHARGAGVCVSGMEEAMALQLDRPAILLAQTTFNEEEYEAIAAAMVRRFPDLEVLHTVCDATSRRQEEARAMAGECDAVVVVGGKNSANTRRLAQIVESLGKPAFLVEDESELPPEAGRFRRVGVTAGASTPHWLIHRVAERLTEMQATGPLGLLWKGLAFLVRSNLLTGLSALGLTLLSLRWQGYVPAFALLAVPPLYLFAVHILNSFSESRAQEVNEPAQRLFMLRHRRWLLPLSWAALALAAAIAALASPWVGLLTLSATVLGLLYQVRLPIARLRLAAIPGSKDLFTAAAWAVFTGWVPSLVADGALSPRALFVSGVVFAVILVRALAYDLRDLQGDRMVGKETLPIYLGQRASRVLAGGLLGAAAGLAVWGTATGHFATAGGLVFVLPLHALLYLWLFQSRRITGSIAFTGVVDGCCPVLGALALAM